MRSFDQSYSSSPVSILPAQHPHPPSFDMNSNRPTFASPFTNDLQQSSSTSSGFATTPTQSTPRSAAGRKRSRDEAAPNLEDDYFTTFAPIAEPELVNEDEWEYGEGMTLIKKEKGYIPDASSQTQDWAEEKAAEEKAKAAAVIAAAADAARPIIRATKSQRLHLSSTPAIPDVSGNAVEVLPGSPERHVEPTVDHFTRHLGIGWSSMSNASPDLQAAARGWGKFIENHFPITNVQVQLTSKSLESYLVEASEGFFLFGEDLKQGRLVSASLEKTWENLRGPIPVFDSDVVMEAGQTPKNDMALQPAVKANGDCTMNGIQAVGVGNCINRTSIDGSHMAEPYILDGFMGSDSNGVNGSAASAQNIEVEMDMS